MAYLGKTPSQAVRSRYFYTATGGETSLSGADNNGDTLIFADGNYVDVYLNGVLLVAGTDYNVNTTNTIAGLVALTASDIVEIVVYDTFSVFGGTFQGALTADSINADIFGSHQFTARNVQGSTILKGTPVYIAGHSGNDSEIAIADADVAAKMPAFGIAATDIANNTKGNVVVFGNYIGIDTSAFAVGDELYVSNTGTLTTTRPSGSADKVQKIAKVIRSQSQNGQIFVMGAGRSNDTPNAITTNSINLSSSTTVSSVLDEDAMTSNSATALATQQSIKAYVDNQIGSNNELSEILTNGNTTGGNNIAFGDNDKAIFGAGSDLQIYHDSTAGNSYIDDAGTGWLYLRADERVLVASQSTGNISAKFFTNAQAELAYNNATKLATTATGVDVTGTVTADDLDLSVGTAGDGIQVTSTGANYLNLGFDTNRTGASQTLSQIEQKWNGTTVARMLFVTGSDTVNKDDAEIRFQTASAGTPATAMTIASSGRVGIGTALPTQELELKAASIPTFKLNQAGTYGAEIALRGNDLDIAGSANAIVFYTGGNNDVSTTERIRILPTGGITFNGDTAQANALDDYEEGTWTGTLKGLASDPTTPVTATGTYTKIGRMVHAEIKFSNVSNVGASGNAFVSGIPFAANVSYASSGNCASYRFDFPTGLTSLSAQVTTTSLYPYVSGDSVDWDGLKHAPGTARYLEISASYITT